MSLGCYSCSGRSISGRSCALGCYSRSGGSMSLGCYSCSGRSISGGSCALGCYSRSGRSISGRSVSLRYSGGCPVCLSRRSCTGSSVCYSMCFPGRSSVLGRSLSGRSSFRTSLGLSSFAFHIKAVIHHVSNLENQEGYTHEDKRQYDDQHNNNSLLLGNLFLGSC